MERVIGSSVLKRLLLAASVAALPPPSSVLADDAPVQTAPSKAAPTGAPALKATASAPAPRQNEIRNAPVEASEASAPAAAPRHNAVEPPPLELRADLLHARGVQIRVDLTLVSHDNATLSMYTLRHAGDYDALLHGNVPYIVRTLTENPWVADTGAKSAQQVVYPRFRLTHEAFEGGSGLTAVIGSGQCELKLKITDVAPAADNGSVHIRMAPAVPMSPACISQLPKLREVTADIVPQAYEYYPPGSNIPAIFELNGAYFAITSNPLVRPENDKDLGIYRDTLTVQGTQIDKAPAPGVKLAHDDLLWHATLFSGFALIGQGKYVDAVQGQNYPYAYAWLRDLAKSRPYFSDGVIYHDLTGQSIQWVYYPGADGKAFTVSEMTFRRDGELEELCRYPMSLNQVTFHRKSGEIPAIIIDYAAPDLANSTFCKEVQVASYPSRLNVTLTPEVLDAARINDILGIRLPVDEKTSQAAKKANPIKKIENGLLKLDPARKTAKEEAGRAASGTSK